MDGDDNETHGNIKKSSDASDTSSTTSTITFTPGEIKVDETPVGEVPQIGEEEGEGINEELPDDFTVEDCEMLCNSIINVPSIFAGAYLIRTPEQVKPFANELYKYCVKKGINPMDYFFDEFGLLIAGVTLAGGMYKDYTEHKEKEKKKETDVDKNRLPGHREEKKEEEHA